MGRTWIWVAAGAAGWLTAGAPAQSFNVDMNAGAGAGAGAPATSFKGAAGQAGFWNAVTAVSPATLVDLAGNATSVTLTRSGAGTIVNNSNGALVGDDEKLLEDAFASNSGVPVSYAFNNLQAGTYAVFTYAIDPSSAVTSLVNVQGSTSQWNQQVGSLLSGPNYFVGVTHALHVVTVAADGSINVSVLNGLVAEIAGFQLVRLPEARLRLYVDDSAAGMHTGGVWSDAFNNPVPALDTTRIAGAQNCEVWVANGFYKPTSTTDRYVSFEIPSHLKFYGGFAGNETSIDQRGNNLCYLNGNIGDPGQDSDNTFVVVVADGTAADTLIDGFRIHNGYQSDSGCGAGMRMLGGNATVRDCTFVHNSAGNYGAGVFSLNGAPKFVNCLFYQNESFSGSGVYHEGPLSIGIYNCRFMDNNTFDGTVHFEDSDGFVAGCWFNGNHAAGNGAAVDADGYNSQPEVVNCTIVGNYAGQTVGGVIARAGADVRIENSILWANTDQFSPTVLERQYDATGADSTIVFTTSVAEGAPSNQGFDPLFVDGDGPDNVWGTFDDDCRLQQASPCINTGANAHLPPDLGDLDRDGDTAEPLPFDFAGDVRIRDVVVDKGAFEFQGDCNFTADLDGDGDVDLGDLATLLAHFGTQSGASASDGDIDTDTDVDLGDLAGMLSQFGSNCP